MGKLRKKHNWKGRQQRDPQQPADEEKTDIVVELQGKTLSINWSNCYGAVAAFLHHLLLWKCVRQPGESPNPL